MTPEGVRALSTEFQIFISSTVEDLKPVRKKLLCALEQPGRIVRCSEDPRFPVEPGMTSHDACLAVVRRCHAFILLIGIRFGGEYQNQGKSITWREWEEAYLSGLTPIILVNRKTNQLCRFVAKERARRRRRGRLTRIRTSITTWKRDSDRDSRVTITRRLYRDL
jgi:hypothetical protein